MEIFLPYVTPYPSHAFPGLSGELMHSLTRGGISSNMVGTQLIAFIGLLTQGIADVQWPNGAKAPVGANSLLVAPSGTGKSMLFKILMDPIEKKLIERNKGRGAGKRLDFLLEDVTREAIIQSLGEWPVAGLFTDEAGQLKGLLKDAPTLVKLLDGSSLHNARVSTGRVALIGQRFSMLMMEQPQIFKETKLLMGATKGGVGLINRFFVASFNGHSVQSSVHQVGLSDSVKRLYEQKIDELLDASIQHVDQQIEERPALRLSAEASHYLNTLRHEERRNCTPGAPLSFISEYVSRHVERTLRLAGALHVFEYGTEGELSLDTLQRAATLGQWYLDAFAQIAYEPPKQSQAELDAAEIERELQQIFVAAGVTHFRQSEMRASAVNLGLTPARFDNALSILGGQKKIRIVFQRKTYWI